MTLDICRFGGQVGGIVPCLGAGRNVRVLVKLLHAAGRTVCTVSKIFQPAVDVSVISRRYGKGKTLLTHHLRPSIPLGHSETC
jgi:hypothetical protein